VKTRKGKEALTLGELIESGCVACGKRRTSAIIRLAAKARLILLRAEEPARHPVPIGWNELFSPLRNRLNHLLERRCVAISRLANKNRKTSAVITANPGRAGQTHDARHHSMPGR